MNKQRAILAIATEANAPEASQPLPRLTTSQSNLSVPPILCLRTRMCMEQPSCRKAQSTDNMKAVNATVDKLRAVWLTAHAQF